MREIEFRGKRIDNGEWVENGSYVYIHKDDWGQRNHLIYNLYGENPKSVDPNTVGQFTGLKDKNGKKIYEGDITVAKCYPSGKDERSFKNRKCVVKWSGYGFTFLVVNEKDNNSLYHYGGIVLGQNGDKLEVIGNIHDNKELLEND